MRKNYCFIYIIILMLFISGCSTAKIKSETTELKAADQENIEYLLGIIKKYNSGSLQSYTLKINVEGHSGTRKFKVEGNALYNNNPKRMKIVFHDAILMSSISEIVQEDNILKFYFPIDKTLYVENTEKINLKAYTDFSLDFNLVSDLLSGRIPVIRQFAVYKGLECETDPAIKENKLIILENSDFFETISFLNDIPDKILWVNKNSKERLELYLKSPVIRDNFLFYKEAKIISREADLNVLIRFSSVKFNEPVDPEIIAKIKIPKDAVIIRRD